MPVKDLEREMIKINKQYAYPMDFEELAKEYNITVRELVANWDFYIKEENNF